MRWTDHAAVLGQLPNLCTLELCRFSGLDSLNVLAQCPSLRELGFSDCNQRTDVTALGKCISLHSLELSAIAIAWPM